MRSNPHQPTPRSKQLSLRLTNRHRAAVLWLLQFALLILLVVADSALVRVLLILAASAVAALLLRAARPGLSRVNSEARPSAILVTPEARVLEQAVDGVRSALGADRTVLWRLTTRGETARPWIARGGPYPDPVRLGGDVLGWAVSQGVSLRSDVPPSWAIDGVRACAVTPVRTSNSVDLLSIEYSDPQNLPAVPDLERAAAYLAAFIDLEMERAESVLQRQRLDALMQVLRRLPAEIEPRTLAQQLAASAIELSGASSAAVSEWTGDSGHVLAAAGSGSEVVLDLTFAANESETAIAARSGSSIVRSGRGRRALPIVAPKERFATRVRALAALPLNAGGKVVGVLTVWSPNDSLDAVALESLEALTPYAALQFRHAQAFGQLRERADRDRLTALFNRQAFETQLEAEFARYDRYGRPFALLMIDIDHFKDVNDRYGHQIGDAVLATVGRILTKTLRGVDVAGRWGGEEFAVLLPETSLEMGIEIAERLRIAIAVASAQTAAGNIKVTTSIGVSAVPECAATAETLIGTADAALYASKRAGRNRVKAAED